MSAPAERVWSGEIDGWCTNRRGCISDQACLVVVSPATMAAGDGAD